MRHIVWAVVLAAVVVAGCEPDRGTFRKGGPPPPMDPEAEKVLTAFRAAVSVEEWSDVLALCVRAVRDEAGNYASAAAFCRAVLPVEEIASGDTVNAYASKIQGGAERQVVEYQWSVSLNGYEDVYWFCALCRKDTEWLMAFSTEPLSQYVEKVLADRKRRAEEYQRQRAVLLPKLQNIAVRLTAAKSSFALGEPMPFRLEMTNGGSETLYYDDQQVDVNDSMIVKDSRDRKVAYIAGSVQTCGASRPIEPGQTVVLFDGFDLASQYKMKAPGAYTVQFSGKGLSVGHRVADDVKDIAISDPTFALWGECESNIVKIQVLRARG